MMKEPDVVALLKQLEQAGIDVWIDGGWGVDALLQRQTRPHNDIDIFIQKKDGERLVEMLISDGYHETKMEYTTDDHTVWHGSNNRIIDLHVFEFAANGTLRFNNETYTSDVLNGKGAIGGVTVGCLTPEAQLLYHQGYELKEKDLHDIRLICETFGHLSPNE